MIVTASDLDCFIATHYDAVHHRVARYIRDRLGDAGRAYASVEDAFHDAIVVMLEKCPINGIELTLDAVSGYLAAVVRRQLANLHKKLARRAKIVNWAIDLARSRCALILAVTLALTFGARRVHDVPSTYSASLPGNKPFAEVPELSSGASTATARASINSDEVEESLLTDAFLGGMGAVTAWCDDVYCFPFTIPEGVTQDNLSLLMNVDDQGVAFLNGRRISTRRDTPDCNPDFCYTSLNFDMLLDGTASMSEDLVRLEEVSPDFTPAPLPTDLSPSMVVAIQPAGLSFSADGVDFAEHLIVYADELGYVHVLQRSMHALAVHNSRSYLPTLGRWTKTKSVMTSDGYSGRPIFSRFDRHLLPTWPPLPPASWPPRTHNDLRALFRRAAVALGSLRPRVHHPPPLP